MPVYQEVTILFFLTRWMETVLYSQMFYAIIQFCAQVKFATLDGNIASVSCSILLSFSDTVLSMGMVQQLVSVLRSPHSSVHEHVLGALCWLVALFHD